MSKQSTSKDPVVETEDTRVTETAIREHEAAVEPNAAPEANNAGEEDQGHVALHGKGKKASDGMSNRRQAFVY